MKIATLIFLSLVSITAICQQDDSVAQKCYYFAWSNITPDYNSIAYGEYHLMRPTKPTAKDIVDYLCEGKEGCAYGLTRKYFKVLTILEFESKEKYYEWKRKNKSSTRNDFYKELLNQ